MTLQERLSTGRGKWTPEYPELGTGPVSYHDAISPEFFDDEREAIFKRWWLYVGRVERLRRPGTYFTRELPGLASIVVARDLEGTIHAFHNVCAHRGNKVVWQEFPSEETSGSCRAFHCKYHGWQYGLDGKVDHVTNEEQFFDLPRESLAMPNIRCEEVGGFIYINLDHDAEPLRDFLGERVCEIEQYPFHLMTQRYGFSTRVNGNWKMACNTIQEWYHPPYVHQAFIHADVREAEKLVPPVDAYHYDLFGKHFINSVPGPPPLRPREKGAIGEARRDMIWVYKLFRGGLFGPDDVADIGPMPEFLNPGELRSWSNDQFWILPNVSLQIWARNFYILYTYWPESVGSHIYDIDIYFVPPENATQRLAQELVVNSVIEVAMQDVNTVEATYSAVKTGAQKQFHLSDQELMIRSFHHTIDNAVAEYRAERDGGTPGQHRRQRTRNERERSVMSVQTVDTSLPTGFEELEVWVADWVQPGRDERYAVRLSKTIGELSEFYDAIAARAEDALEYLDALDLNDLADDADRLLHLLYSMVLVSYSVNVFKQPHIPDSGSAFFNAVIAPAV